MNPIIAEERIAFVFKERIFMKIIIIDFTGAKYIDDLHEIIRQSFQSTVEGLPDFCEKNLEALWDCVVKGLFSDTEKYFNENPLQKIQYLFFSYWSNKL